MQENPFLNSAVANVTLDDDFEVKVPLGPTLTHFQRQQLAGWVATTKLDADQRTVVHAPVNGTYKVLANAGSGKTHTLIARAIHILASTDIEPSKLVLLTFTNRAAREIKERYKAVLKEVLQQDNIQMPFIGTIHGFSYHMLSQVERQKQTILTEGAGRSLMRRLITTELFPDDKEKKEMRFNRLVHDTYQELCANNELHLFAWPVWIGGVPEIMTHRNLKLKDHAETFRYVDQTCRTVNTSLCSTPNKFISPTAVELTPELRADIRRHYSDKVGLSVNEFTTIIQAFMAAKYSNRTFEFVDLLYYPLAFLSQNAAALEKIWGKVQYVFQDEAQDQDTLQYALLRLVAGKEPNLLFCADTKQTLYFWRNARPDVTEHLDRINSVPVAFPGGHSSAPQEVTPLYLRTNYRSAKQIVDISNLFADKFTTKAATHSIPFKEPLTGTLAIRTYDNTYTENKAVARDIALQVRAGKRKFSDFAVLTYTNRALLDLEAACIAERIPYHLKHDNRSTTKQSTFRVMAAYYALAINPRDVPALCELLEPIKGLGDKFLLKLQVRLNKLFQDQPLLTIDNLDIAHIPDAQPAHAQYKQMRMMLDNIVLPFVKKVRSGRISIPDLNQELRILYDENGTHENGDRGLASLRPFEWQFTAEALRKVTRTLDHIYHTLMEDPEFQQLTEPQRVHHIHGILALGSDDKEPDDLDDAYDKDPKSKNRVVLSTGHAFKGKQAPVVYVTNLRGLAPPKSDFEEEQRCWFYVAITRPEQQLILTASAQAPDFKGQLRTTNENSCLNDFVAVVARYKEAYRKDKANLPQSKES